MKYTCDGFNLIGWEDGTVTDLKTELMWAAKDSGYKLSQQSAKSYCKNYRGGGYTDWRMPTTAELKGLYDDVETYKSECGSDVHLTELIRLNCAYVAGSGDDDVGAYINFVDGSLHLTDKIYDYAPALPVRSGK